MAKNYPNVYQVYMQYRIDIPAYLNSYFNKGCKYTSECQELEKCDLKLGQCVPMKCLPNAQNGVVVPVIKGNESVSILICQPGYIIDNTTNEAQVDCIEDEHGIGTYVSLLQICIS